MSAPAFFNRIRVTAQKGRGDVRLELLYRSPDDDAPDVCVFDGVCTVAGAVMVANSVAGIITQLADGVAPAAQPGPTHRPRIVPFPGRGLPADTGG